MTSHEMCTFFSEYESILAFNLIVSLGVGFKYLIFIVPVAYLYSGEEPKDLFSCL